jgi:beta-phosphoglucomutase family hydrolase
MSQALEELAAVIFDLDGVVTQTAKVHAAAWREAFRPLDFDPVADYRRYVDGKSREDGARDFLAARGVAASEEKLQSIAVHKDTLFKEKIREGVEVYEGTLKLIRALRARGVRTAVVTASRNATAVLRAAGAEDLFDARVDGNDAARLGLAGKPAPDTFLRAAKLLGVAPARAAVVEDALAGVAAGRAGGFAVVIGVDRSGQAAALREHGATRVVRDLGELELAA